MDEKNKEQSLIKLFFLPALFVTLVAIVAGWLLGARLIQSFLPKSSATHSGAYSRAHAEQDKVFTKDAHVILLDPIVVNARDSSCWINGQFALIMKEEKKLPPEVIGSIANDFTALLHSTSVEQLQGAVGLLHLRQDLLDRAKIRSEGEVIEVLVLSLVVGR